MEKALTPATNATNIQSQLEAVIAGMDISPETRRKYAARAEHIAAFIGSQMAAGVPAVDWLPSYKRELLSSYSAATAAVYFAAARAVFKRLYTLGLTPSDLTGGVKGVKTSRGHKRAGVSKEEVSRLKSVLTGADPRTRAIIALLLLQGLRQIEVSRLNVTDVNLTDGTLLVQGKGRDDKTVVNLNPATVEALRVYLKGVDYTGGPLFRSVDRAHRGSRLTTRSIRRITKSVFAIADINKAVHGLRHYFVTTLLEALQGDVVKVQQWSRHATLDMLVIYNDEINTLKTAPAVFAALGALTL